MTKIHIDTDIGGDIDDLCALAMVLCWPDHRRGGQADLIGVTTVAEHDGKRAAMVRYVLGLAGRTDIPVAAGAPAMLDCYRMFQGLPDENTYWPEGLASVGASRPSLAEQPDLDGAPAREPTIGASKDSPLQDPPLPALDLLASSIAQGAVIVAIGPYTNLALLERRSPGILSTARLALMGGYLFPPRYGYPAWNHEMDWNVQVDVTSALTVFEQATNPTLVPVAVTVETFLRRSYLPRLRQSGPLGARWSIPALIALQAEAHAIEYKNEVTYGRMCANLPSDIINFQHDPLACAIALGWNQGVELRDLTVKSEIRDGWMRQSIDPGGRPVRLVSAVDGDAFSQFWLEVVTGN
jgi:purine nucleosidase